MRTSLAILLFSVAACGSDQSVDNDNDLDAPVGKADGASVPGGAYTNATPHYGELSTMVLNPDHTFKRSAIQACAGGGTCAPLTQTGTFLLTHSSTKHYIHFYDADGTSLDKYQWKITSGTLKLDYEGDDHWFTIAKGSACEAAAGNCVPLVPDACEFGSIGDANEFSCGGGLGTECCLPLAGDNGCNADSDCSGGLPHFCKVCENGETACAHWSCVENSCQIASCN